MKKIKLSSWIYWTKIVVGFLILIILYKKINQSESVFDVLKGANPIYIFVALLLLIPHVYIAFLKWRYLLRTRFEDISTKEIFGSLLFGITLGMVTPGNLGELGRGLFFQNRNKLVITGLTVIDKLSNMLVITTLGFISIFMITLKLPAWQADWVYATAFSGIAILGSLWLSIFKSRWIKRIVKKVAMAYPKNLRLQAFMEAFMQIKRKDILSITGLTILWFAVIMLQYHVLILGFTDVDLIQSFQGVTAAIFTKMLLPISFGGLGIREGVTVFYFSLFDISRAAVFNASLIIFLINFMVPGLTGFYYLLQLNSRGRKVGDPTGQAEPVPFLPGQNVESLEQAQASSKNPT